MRGPMEADKRSFKTHGGGAGAGYLDLKLPLAFTEVRREAYSTATIQESRGGSGGYI